MQYFEKYVRCLPPNVLAMTPQSAAPQVPAVVAVLQAARTQGLLDDLDSVVAAADAASPLLADSLTPAASGAADRASARSSGSSVSSEDSYGGGGGDGSMIGCAGMRVPLALLQSAVTSRNEALRLDALQLVTGNPRMTSLPGLQAPCKPALVRAFSRPYASDWRHPNAPNGFSRTSCTMHAVPFWAVFNGHTTAQPASRFDEHCIAQIQEC